MKRHAVQRATVYAYTLPEKWSQAIDGWVMWMRLAGQAPSTIKLRRDHVRSVARRLHTESPAATTLADLVTLFGGAEWSREHRRSMRTAMTAFYDWAVENGCASENIAEKLPRVAVPRAAPRPVSEGQWQELLDSVGPREHLMARLAGELGMRRAEVAQAHLRDLVRTEAGWSMIVAGKGGRQRTIPVPDDLAEEIRAWCRGGWLFPGGVNGHLSTQYVGILMSRLLGDATMHQLRHRFASRGYEKTHDIRALQQLLGHSSLATTQRYIQGSEAAERKVVEAVGESSATPGDPPLRGPLRGLVQLAVEQMPDEGDDLSVSWTG